MRRVHQRVVVLRPFALRHAVDFATNSQHRVDKAVQFNFAFRFGRFNHQRARHREGHGRRVETIVDKTLGDIQLADTGHLFQRTNIQNAFVRHAAVSAGIEHRIGVFQAARDVVRVEDGRLARFFQPLRSHHADIHPAYRQNRRAAERRRGNRALRGQHAFNLHHAVARYERRQVRFHANRAHARTAAAVRNAERFMQVKMRHIRADVARRGDAHLGVHVGAVEVNLAAVLMHDVTHFADGFFIHSVGGRVGDHDAGELIARRFGFGTQIGEIDIALLITGDHHHLHPRHLRRRRVSAVRGARNKADIAMAFVATLVIMANRQQARVFTLRAGVRLHAQRVVAGQFHQPVGELANHLQIPFRLIRRTERMQLGEFRPGDRDHFRRRVKFHGAGAKRDHRLIQRQIFTLEAVHIAHHLGFAVVAIKDRMRQDRVIAQHRGRNGAAVMRHVFIQRVDIHCRVAARDHAQQRLHIGAGRGFIKRNAHRARNIAAQVDFTGLRARQNSGFIRHLDAQGVEPGRVTQLQSFLLQARRQNIGETVNAAGDTLQPCRAVEHGVEARDIGQQHLGGTDVGVRFLAANVLLAGLHRHTQRGAPGGVFRHADNAPRHRAFKFIAGGKERGVRAAIAHRDAKTLGGAEDDIRALFARRGQEHQRHKIGRHAHNHFAGFQLANQFAIVMHLTGGADLLQQHAEQILMIERLWRVIDDHLKAERFGAGADHIQRLRMHIRGHEETIGVFQFADAFGHRHGFRRRGGFIEQRGGGDIEPRQIQRHLLEVQKRFQTPL
ncbi:hypothetical protein BN136_1595 [Cronobacter universalis NCTC 9529]|nr:hypothetical protein BN136_1595 [Cronobacter universalis NCTC 9529]